MRRFKKIKSPVNDVLAEKILKTARQAALDAGKVVRKNIGHIQKHQIHVKSANNFVTESDKRSERMIISSIHKNFKDHAILAEESGRSQSGEFMWIIDPIDGTSNFIHSFPMFSISIGVAFQGQVFAGVIYDPSNQELFSARYGKGAYLNNKRIGVSSTQKLGDSFLATGIPFRGFQRSKPYMKSFKQISLGSASIRRGGSAALDLAYVACGRYDGYWEMALSPWDIAAGCILVREAGGEVTDLRGGEGFLESGDILATNALIHPETLKATRVIPCR